MQTKDTHTIIRWAVLVVNLSTMWQNTNYIQCQFQTKLHMNTHKHLRTVPLLFVPPLRVLSIVQLPLLLLLRGPLFPRLRVPGRSPEICLTVSGERMENLLE